EPVQGYHVELVIHQGPKKADGSSILSHPSLCLAEGQPGLVHIGQQVRLWGEAPRDIGVRAEGKIRSGKDGLVLWLKMEHSELVHDAKGNPQISTVQTELESAIRLDALLVAKPVKIGEKALWAEVRARLAPR